MPSTGATFLLCLRQTPKLPVLFALGQQLAMKKLMLTSPPWFGHVTKNQAQPQGEIANIY